jgi:glycosyltransferase involved in cell wall biosynthesis
VSEPDAPDPAREPAITVVLPARDAAATLPDTLAAVTAQRGAPPFEVIVVDDGSTDATAEIAAASAVVDRVLRTGPGAGPGAARNAGAAAARAARLAFLDADCRPAPGWVAAGHTALDGAELVLGETRPRADRRAGPLDRTVAVRGPSPLFEAANLFADRAAFERLGGFERWLGPRDGKELGEDVWLGWRARRAGARIAFCPAATAEHEVFPRTAAAYVAERWRLRYFPAMIRRIPELRSAFLYRRRFLNPRTARFDVALAALAASAITRRAAPAAAALPYARTVYGDVRTGVGLAGIAADTVGLAALLTGSVRYRSLLL